MQCTDPIEGNASDVSGGRTAVIKVDPGETVTCTWTNAKRPTVTVEKSSSGGDGTFAFALAGSGGSTKDVTTEDGSGSATWGPADLTPGGTYTLSETVLSGWASQFTGCVNTAVEGDPAIGTELVEGVGVTLDPLPAGATVECSFTNAKRPTVTVEKSSSGGDGTFAFALDGPGAPGSQDVTTEDGSGSATWGPADLTPGGTYTLSETVLSGWASQFTGCVNTAVEGDPAIGTELVEGVGVTLDPLPAGATVECSFTNAKRPTVTVEKSSSGGDGTFAFALAGSGGSTKDVTTEDGSGSASWGPADLTPGGTYTLSETVLSGWASQFTGCVNTAVEGDPAIGTELVEGVGVTLDPLPAGATVECSFTNAKRPTVTVEKSSSGGDGTFAFTLDGPGAPGSQDVTTEDGSGSASWGPADLTPGGTYTLTETEDPAYVSTSTGCTYSVNGEELGPIGSPGEGASVDLDSIPAGADVTCSFTNVHKARIQVRKVTDPAGQPDEFTFSLNSTPPQQVTAAGDDPSATAFSNLVPANVEYAVTETGIPAGPPAWDPNGGVCQQEVAGVLTGTPVNAASVTPGPGETWTCTFTNTKRATITVKKQTTPSSPEQGFDFNLSGGPTAADPITGLTSGNANGQQFAPATGVKPGTYTVAEVNIDPGWYLDSSSCDRADVAGDDAASPTTLQVKAGENWICTFQDTKYGQITVQKVTNPAQDPTNFDFAFTGRPGFQLADGGSQAETLLKPGAYDITETVPSGWSLTGVTCDEIAQTPVNGKITVNLTAGQNVTCTYTNTKLGQITVQKVTNPAQDPTNFAFAFTGRPGFQLAGGGSHAEPNLLPGAYDITETVPSGWSLTGVTCGEVAQSPVNGKITVNLSAGQDVTCTYTNLKLAQITVRKVTTPAQNPTNFAFAFTGRPGFQLAGGGSHAEPNLLPGAYDITESVPTGWVLTSVACDGVPQSPVNGKITVNVAAGQSSTCTYTNVLNTAPFTVLKDFSDGNPAAVSVSVQCTAGSVFANDSSASEADPARFTVSGFVSAAATTCTATESNVPVGYSSFGSCSASLAAGTCTITNVLNTASFIVGKDFTDDNPADVTVALECSAGNVTTVDPTASESDPANFTVSGFTNRAATTCTATESNVPASYTDSGPCTASLADGACTITNTPVVVVAGIVTKVSTDSAFLRRALVAGESVQLSGRVPADCSPILRIDGQTLGPVDTARNGDFDLAVPTRDLSTGKHVAEVACKNRNAVLVRKTFWIAAPISSSNILFIALASLLVLFGIGWVALRTLAGNSTEPRPVAP